MSEFYGHKKTQRIATKCVILYPQTKTSHLYPTDHFENFSRDRNTSEELCDPIDYHFREGFNDYIIGKNVIGKIITDRDRDALRDREIRNLRRLVSVLYFKLSKIESQFPDTDNVQEVRDIPLEEAKLMVRAYVKKYLQKHKKIYPSDVSDALRIPYTTVREVFGFLEQEGKLKESE